MTIAKQERSRVLPSPMELDLDSLLRSHGADPSSSDDETSPSSPAHRRTLDEILNASSSSSPSSSRSSTPPSSPTHIKRDQTPVPEERPTPLEPAHEALEGPTSSASASATATASWRAVRSKELSSLGLRLYSSTSATLPPLPPLFGGVRPNPKPGAALAAAAAASRSVPTPHAAAIKSRWASTGSLQGALQTQEFREDRTEASAGSEGLDGSDLSEAILSEAKLEAVEDVRVESVSAVSRSSSSSSSSSFFEAKAVSEVISRDELLETDGSSSSTKEPEIREQLEGRDELLGSNFGMQAPAICSEDASPVDEGLPLGDAANVVAEHAVEGTCEVELMEPEPETCELGQETSQGEDANANEEESKIADEIDKLVEERLSRLEHSKKAEKKLRASMKPLEWAEELEKRQASSGLHWEEGAVSQPMRLEGIRRGPPAVGYLQIDLDNAVTRTISVQAVKREHGSPHVVAVHINFIAVGMSKGAVLVFPSKYSIHSADNMDSKMLTFGSHGEKSQTPVTSMCFNQPGDLLLVGYGDGHLTVWDVQKATAAKLITGEHSAPVVHALFLGQDSQVTRQFKAVTGDSKGLVLLHTFSVVPLLNRFSIKTQCLLDGQKTGTVLSACSIVTDVFYGTGCTSSQVNLPASSSSLGSMVGGVVGGVVGGESGWKLFNEGSSLAEEGVVIFVTHQNALVVRLSPNVEVYEKFNKPDGVREGSMPYAAWKCTTYLHGTSDKASWLVIAWDRRVQVAKLVKSEMKRYKEWNLDSAAIGVAWLDDQMLVVLTLKGQLCLFAKDGTEIHRTSFVVDGSGMDDIVTYHTRFTNTFGNPEKAYHNCVAVRGASIYILGPMHLLVSRLLPWKEWIQVLQRAGDWMGVLDMAMRLYDGQAHGVIDLPRTVDAIREVIMPYLVELLFSYVEEVFSYISLAFCNQIGKLGQVEVPLLTGSSQNSDIEEQYARVGGVAVEFCVHIKRTDILFDSIFSKFVAVQHGGTFLEILEPYILRDMLGCLPPEIMQALVEHYSGKGWLQRVEQCVLHMDISSLDFNQVVKLCRENGLYGALIYLFNRGLDDFRTPLEELLVVVQSGQRMDVAAVGYRMLVYLKYCFQGLAFPPGHGTLSSSRLLSVKKDLLQFLLEDSKPSTSQISKSFRSSCGTCPNLCHLLWLDTEATLEVLRCAFQEEETKKSDNSIPDLAILDTEQEKDKDAESLCDQNLMIQSATDILIFILDLESDTIRSFAMDDNLEVWPSTKDLAYLFEFIAFLVTHKRATISERVLKHILEHMTSHNLPPCGPSDKTEASQKEKRVLALLKIVPQTDWSYPYVLHLCMEAQFHQACGFLYTIRGQYIAALDSYMKDHWEPVHAFAFIDRMMLELKDTQASSFQSAVLTRIPELLKLSRECSFFLFLDHFSKEGQHILLQLHSHPESLFLFLKTAIDVHLSGTLSFSVLETTYASNIPSGKSDSCNELEVYLERLSNFPKLLHHNSFDITDEMAELYLKLLCQYERNSVLKFLETFENYRVEHCLRLCQEYGVTDAAAFLLERVGDVGSALVLLMSGLKEKFDLLVAAIEDISRKMSSSNFLEVGDVDDILKMSEVTATRDVLRACIGLCQRNTQRLDPQESESLWFRLLDSFSEPMRRLCSGKEFTDGKSQCSLTCAISDVKLDEEFLSRWRFNKFDKDASLLRRVFSQFIGEIIEGMAGYVALPAIMAKLLADNGDQEFGDFKFTILRMLGTYGYERRILGTAKSLIEDDAFYTMSLLKKGASHAYAPQNFLCCICGCSLTKESSTSGIRVYSCGHSTHLHCELDENEPFSRGSSAGCPICLPKKNPHARTKSVLDESGLVNNGTSSQTTQGIAYVQHLHEPDVFDKPFGFQPISRFEILSNLQKAQRSLQIDTLPQLRLSPPAIYHEKVQKGYGSLIGEASHTPVKSEKANKRWQLRESKLKLPLNRFPLKSSIFGPEKNKVR